MDSSTAECRQTTSILYWDKGTRVHNVCALKFRCVQIGEHSVIVLLLVVVLLLLLLLLLDPIAYTFGAQSEQAKM